MKIIECPRDAMQGITEFIPTQLKAEYINLLLQVGFDTIDFGSFVSPKAIPQMRDTAELLPLLQLHNSKSHLLAIVANTRGAAEAAAFEEISYLGFPLSVSENFQQRNTNKSIAEALRSVAEIQEICAQKNKKQVVYLSMAFGNPYGDPFEEAIVIEMTEQLQRMGVEVVSLSDTIGSSEPTLIKSLYRSVKQAFPSLELGLHLHSTPEKTHEKIEAALEVACERIDGALKGFGGCPMAKEELTGNIATEKIIDFVNEKQAFSSIKADKLAEALLFANQIFH